MRRLYHFLHGMDRCEEHFYALYGGAIEVITNEGLSYSDEDPLYWQEDISYQIDQSGRHSDDRPDILIRIPVRRLFQNTTDEGEPILKRLKWYFTRMENDTETYSWREGTKREELYNARISVEIPGHDFPEENSDNTYWSGKTSFVLEKGGRDQNDLPTVTAQIPVSGFAPSLVPALEAAKERQNVGETDIHDLLRTAADYCLRQIAPYFDRCNAAYYNRARPDKENGKFLLHRPDAKILTRNAAFFAKCPTREYEYISGCKVKLLPDTEMTPPEMCLCIRMQVQLPFHKLKRTQTMLCRDMPEAVAQFVAEFDLCGLESALTFAEKRQRIRARLRESGEYIAFIADGSILPREKDSELPMRDAVPFVSTPGDAVEWEGVRGMAFRRGVTVITGGGYSGKSTVLDALSAGIYDHIPGDGRELVLTDDTATEIFAEDGRAVSHLNISPFIRWIPGGDTTDFSTPHASGSTSQAANIMEAVDCGARVLLIDEDRSATNFMIRDKMMKKLIHHEPITPFTDRVNELARHGVSTILVIGGSGEYLGVADRVYRMDEYRISDVTTEAQAIWDTDGTKTTLPGEVAWSQDRTLLADGFTSYPTQSTSERLIVSEMGFLCIGNENIDIRAIPGLATPEMQNAAAFLIRYLMVTRKPTQNTLDGALDELYHRVEAEGIELCCSKVFTDCSRFLDLPRPADVKAVIHRMREIQLRKKHPAENAVSTEI